MARQSRPTVLLTRPKAASARFAAQIAARFGDDLPIVISPILEPEFQRPALPQAPIAGLIFTSETGVAAFCALSPLRAAPAWCVGAHTAQAAQAAGFDARAAGGDAASLVATLLAARPDGLLLHARGRDTTGNLAQDLTRAGLTVAETIVYAQIAKPLSSDARHALSGPSAVILPVFSPRTAQLLALDIDDTQTAPLWLASLSPAVDRAAFGLRTQRRQIADRPDALAMLDCLARLLGAAQNETATPIRPCGDGLRG